MATEGFRKPAGLYDLDCYFCGL